MTISTEHVRAQIERLRRLQQTTLKGRPCALPEGSISKLDEIERRLLTAIRRDETGTTQPDGFPTGRVGAGGENAAQSTTEGAALSGWRIDPETDEAVWVGPPFDQHHALTDAAVEALERAVSAIATLATKLDEIDRVATVVRTDPSGYCGACTRWVEGTAVDRLRAGYCQACHRAWDRAGRPDRPAFELQRKRESAA